MAAFSLIVERHQAWAWRIAYRFTGKEEEASDIVQEAFLRLWNASGRYRPEAKFRTYFYRIISRLCLDYTKKKRPLRLDILSDSPDPSPDVEDEIIRQEMSVVVRTALDTLPPNQRLAILFRYDEDLSYDEIAAALSTTVKAVERLLARGRDKLREILGSRENYFDA
ncbi:MAG: sigma-70 family RNA polymerase sigma factor [Candidatus Delongbacteria bacterium]|nr:sigma-70 family RNA polymerase sigma factor [Candidatus Delongbacteria bacterium]